MKRTITSVVATTAILSAVVFAALVAQPALADEGKPKEVKEKEIGKVKSQAGPADIQHRVVVRGSGVATDRSSVAADRSDENFKSEIKVSITGLKPGSVSDDAVRKGSIVVFKDDYREAYAIVPGTWTMTRSDDGLVVTASGDVVGPDGQTYSVKLTGYSATHNGFWSVVGSLGDLYDLHYVARLR